VLDGAPQGRTLCLRYVSGIHLGLRGFLLATKLRFLGRGTPLVGAYPEG